MERVVFLCQVLCDLKWSVLEKLFEVAYLKDVLISLNQDWKAEEMWGRIWVSCCVRDWSGVAEHCALLPGSALRVFGVASETEFRQKAARGDLQCPSKTWNLRGVYCCT